MLISFRFEPLNAGGILSADLPQGPALAVRGSSKSTSQQENLLSRFYRFFFKAEKTIAMSGLRFVTEQSSLYSFEIPWSLYCSLCCPTLDWWQGEL